MSSTIAFIEKLSEQLGDTFAVFENEDVMKYGDQLMDYMHPELDRSLSPVKSWPLARFDHALAVMVMYVLFVLIAPIFMKILFAQPAADEKKKLSVGQKIAKEPILWPLMVIYNASQVALCGWMIAAAIDHYKKNNYTFICNEFDPKESGMAAVLWVFYVSKVLDFCDTFFIVARQKWVQLSFLHTYHHSTIFIFYWLNLNVGYSGDVYYTIVLNGFVHFVMYFYYLVTTFNVSVPKPLKMLITNMQMFQFLTMNAQAIYILAFQCPYPRRIVSAYLVYIISLFFLFRNFATKTYKKKADDKKTN